MSEDVIIVGAGPTGLLLAGDLAQRGVACTVLERRAEESNLTRAFAVHARSLETLDIRGLADDLVATGQKVEQVLLFGRARLDLTRLPTRYPFLLVTPQYETERLLARRAEVLGAQIEKGAEVTGLRQDASGVDLDVRIGEETTTRRAAYVVGADGAHSAVRQALGVPFPGESVLRSVMLADVRLTDPPPETLTVETADAGFTFMVPFGDGWYRVIAWDRHKQVADDVPVELAELRDLVRRVRGTDYGMGEARWLSRFHSDERQAPKYRSGRVFLAGDAAHVHSPAGGLGMNTGLQDAANLGWKLAAAVQGSAPPGLLDTYQTERHPIGRQALRVSGGALRAALVPSSALRAARGIAAKAALSVDPIGRRAAETVSGIGIHYPAPRGAHRLTGRRMPDLAEDNGRLYERLRYGRFLLVTRSAADAPDLGEWKDRVEPAVAPGAPATALLVRPDGYIAWASDSSDADRRTAKMSAALAWWCGGLAQ